MLLIKDKLLSGTAVAEEKKGFLKAQVNGLQMHGVYPKLKVYQVGDDPASDVYVKHKKNFGKDIGVDVIHVKLKDDITTEELCFMLKRVDCPVIVQLPLPNHINAQKVIDSIPVHWDVDGFTAISQGQLATGQKGLRPCTPKGIVSILQEHMVQLAGKHAVVIGRSNIVGKPIALELLGLDCTVTIAHSKTQNLEEITKQADILVVAMGIPKHIKQDHIKEGAIVVDVGIHRTAEGKLCGDVDFEDVFPKVSAITPVPNGVGKTTVTMLFDNVIESYLNLVTVFK